MGKSVFHWSNRTTNVSRIRDFLTSMALVGSGQWVGLSVRNNHFFFAGQHEQKKNFQIFQNSVYSEIMHLHDSAV